MKKTFSLIFGLIIFSSFIPVSSQVLVRNSSLTGICYAGNKTNRIYIPPPEEFYKKSLSGNKAKVTIFYAGFSSDAKAALAYAGSILETILPADTRLTISASWVRISTTGVLANSSITGYSAGWAINALNPRAYYPVGLAEKIAGRSLNDSLEGDMNLTVNNSINWYLGTDGNTPPTQYDLVTVALHEICHGLGFFDSMGTENNEGYYGIGSAPLIYDTFIENLEGQKLTDTLIFKNPSAALLQQYTGGKLFFNGPLLKNYTSGSRARVYSPSTFDPGSSISHLDETFTIEPNTLMTPFIDMGESIQNPGKFTLSILGDIGWINTRIIHNAPKDTEAHLNQVLLSVGIASDTTYNHDKIGAVISLDNFLTSDTLIMTSPNSDNQYNCTVNIPSYNSELQYYFFAEDVFLRLYRSPSLIDSMRYKIFIGTDTVKPVITHTAIKYVLQTIDTINFKATVTDNLGIDTVYAEYKHNNGPSVFLGMKAGKSDSYSAFLDSAQLSLKGGDSIQYRIIATDTALVPNRSVLPKTGYYVMHVEAISSVLESYSTDFSGLAEADFFNDGFNISKPAGFLRYGLHTKHPYESPEDNDKSIEYTAMLRHPLKLNETGLIISFNEVVLVEPGDPGSVFGAADFYDYVIIDGSKNYGKTWFNLMDGYDSRRVTSWLNTYNNAIVGMNSTASGTEAMLRKHSVLVSPSQTLPAADTFLLRFRLYSDPFANGWGWLIEDLKIGPLVDAVETVAGNSAYKIYPNPGKGSIRISSGDEKGKAVRYSVFTSSGICIKSDNLTGDQENFVNISDYPSGIYFVVLKGNGWIKTIKYSLIK